MRRMLKALACIQGDSLLLEGHIKALQESMGVMTEHPSNKSRMYVTNDDIIKLSSIGEDVVFAVTAPYGTTLLVPDPDEEVEKGGERRYRWAIGNYCRLEAPVCRPLTPLLHNLPHVLKRLSKEAHCSSLTHPSRYTVTHIFNHPKNY